jgi:para-nitrobenzyl esterase
MPRRFTVLLTIITLICLTAMAASLLAGCGGSGTQTATAENQLLESGPISGTLEDGIWTYKGIPYAAPPVGELRWKEPQPVEAWTEVRPCTEYGPACPQPEADISGFMEIDETDEDCLYLNVWTPAEGPGESLPVMVWIHGGAFTTGSGSQEIYNGHYLAEKGVVVVTINYRLGPLGFMAHPLLSEESPHGVSGNYGLLDQIASLEWVKENIEAFGGDPDNITVFGESAGGISILDLMVSPLATGLFDRAIVESGPMLELGLPIDKDMSLEEAERSGTDMAAALGCSQEENVLACLRSKTPQELISAPKPLAMLASPIAQGPNVDGWVLPDEPSALFAAGYQQSIPLLIGTNADEGSIFAPEILQGLYWGSLVFLYGDFAAQVNELYPVESQGQVKPTLSRLITEMGFAASSKLAAASMTEVDAPAYLYEFTRLSNDPRAEGRGSFHGLEIVYVFGTFDEVRAEGAEQADYDLSEAMMTYWTNFAATGDPNGRGVPEWPAYDIQSDLYQELGTTISTQSGYYPQAYELVMRISGY